ncbi:hypothetical protein SDC9_165906 [bioreactor metagenome]|uniref:Major facilitator superfamily (MFS) profile domain-containing protein n=1 Tax=bioreactor metagenome TaxID=1076179 RepID=A0A645FXE4_9ZZZZ
MAGTVGFAIVSVIMGRLADISINNIFLVFGVVGLLTIISAFFLPKVAGHGAKTVKTDWGPLFKNKALLIVLALMFMIQLTMTFFNSYQSVYYKEQGLDLTVLGFSLLLQTISEVPFMLFSHKLIKKFGAGVLMFFCSAVLMLRWFLLFLVKSTVPVLLLQFMHGPSFVFATVVMAMFMNENMSPELKARGQIFISLTSSFSRVIGNLIGGFLIDAFGSTRPILLLFAILMAINIVVMFFLFKKVGGFKNKA